MMTSEEALRAVEARLSVCARWRTTAGQLVAELSEAFAVVAEIRPERFLEIGSELGGSLWVYAAACAPGARLVSLTAPGEDGSVDERLGATAMALARDGFGVEVISGDSHDKATMAAALRALGGPVDVVHVDGDHSHEGVLSDWRAVAPAVRAGGVMLFHDVAGETGAAEAWAEIRACYGRTAKIARGRRERDGARMGIGVVWQPAFGTTEQGQ